MCSVLCNHPCEDCYFFPRIFGLFCFRKPTNYAFVIIEDHVSFDQNVIKLQDRFPHACTCHAVGQLGLEQLVHECGVAGIFRMARSEEFPSKFRVAATRDGLAEHKDLVAQFLRANNSRSTGSYQIRFGPVTPAGVLMNLAKDRSGKPTSNSRSVLLTRNP